MRFIDILLAVAVAALWGGNFVSSKIDVAYLPPFFFTGWRFLLVAIVLAPWLKLPSRQQLWHLAQIALALNVLHIALMVTAMHFGLGAGSTALAAELGVPFSCLLGAMFLNDRLGIWRMAGMAAAFVGTAVAAGAPDIASHPLGFGIAMIGAFFWAVANILIKQLGKMNVFQMIGWISALSVPQLMLISVFCEGNAWTLLPALPTNGWLSLAYTAIFSTLVAYSFWYHLLARYPVTHVAPFSLLTPVFGIAFASLIHETLSQELLVGGAITIAGVAVIVARRPKIVEIGET